MESSATTPDVKSNQEDDNANTKTRNDTNNKDGIVNNNSTTTNNKSSASTSHDASNQRGKTTAETDLKASIIEFMRGRPFLWNNRHPNYKDHKRREHEFQQFSEEIHHPVQEIKRVWHVLRTNFFRAHKLLQDRTHHVNGNGSSVDSGEKLWKYYLAMDYILEGHPNGSVKSNNLDESRRSDCSDVGAGDDNGWSSNHSNKTPIVGRQTRSSRQLSCVNPKEAHRAQPNHKMAKTHNNSDAKSNFKNSSGVDSHNSSLVSYHGCDNSNLNNASSIVSTHQHNNSTTFNDSMENDDDYLYARSLSSTLKRFDPTTKEVIKLKFQEIIVNHMQQQRQQQQTQQPPQQ